MCFEAIQAFDECYLKLLNKFFSFINMFIINVMFLKSTFMNYFTT